jgi:Leucine-rich repeat (LRR) protein
MRVMRETLLFLFMFIYLFVLYVSSQCVIKYKLRILYLRVCVFSQKQKGYINEEWGSIRCLRELGLGGNRFTGDIPETLCNLSNLERLDLHENKLYSEIPEDIVRLTALKKLRLHGI